MTTAVSPRLTVGFRTDVGCHRKVNEDAGVAVTPHDPEILRSKGVLVIVADGMGGHSAGEVASRLAVETIRAAYYDSADEPTAALVGAMGRANRAIHEAARANDGLAGMGTTCSALAIYGGGAACGHVGDSRVYLVRGDGIYTMTEDHSVVGDLVKRGLLNEADARRHEERNVILRALGTGADVEVASWADPLPIRPGDGFLVCSDGLHGLVETEELLEAVRTFDPSGACDHLVRLARERGGYDNITVAVVRVGGEDTERAAASETHEATERS